MSCDHELANEWARCSRKNASYITISFIIWLCLTRTGNYQIHEFDWLKWISITVWIFPSRPASTCRPVMFWSEKNACDWCITAVSLWNSNSWPLGIDIFRNHLLPVVWEQGKLRIRHFQAAFCLCAKTNLCWNHSCENLSCLHCLFSNHEGLGTTL